MEKICRLTGYLFACVLCFLSFAVAVSAASGSWGENVTWTYDETTRTLRVSGEREIVGRVWDSENSKTVYPSWHEYRNEIENVIINEGITAIGKWAFDGYTNLTSVMLPKSLLAIDDYAFYGCGFSSIQIPRNVDEIGYGAFNDCRNLSKISVDDENEYFTDKSGVLFDKDMERLICYPIERTAEAYTVPDSVTYIGDWAFAHNGYLKTLILPDALEYIKYGAMWDLSSLHKITIPATTWYIETDAFAYCFALTEIDVDPNNETYASRDGVLFDKDMTKLIAFPCGKRVSEYVVPETVTLIAEDAFCGTSLSSIQLPENLLFIEYAAFYEAENLKTVFIPASVEVLGYGAFEWCTSLESIYFQGDLPYGDYPDYYDDLNDIPEFYLENIWYPTDENDTVDVYYQIGKKGWDTLDADELAEWGIRLLTFVDETDDDVAVSAASGSWGENVTWTYDEGTRTLRVSGEGKIDGSVWDSANSSYIYPSWNEYRNKIENVIIDEGITAIGNGTFNYSSSLTNIKLPESLLEIGSYAFEGCAISYIQIPRNVNTISNYAFNRCRNLSKISVDAENEYFADKSGVLFDKNMERLICYPMGRIAEAYTVPASVTVIGDFAFFENIYLKNLSLPDSLEYIEAYAMACMDSLYKITIPATTWYIGTDAFAFCTALTKIDVDPDNETYGSKDGVLFDKDMTKLIAFPCGKKVSEYAVPETVKLIAEGAFYGTSLSSIQLSENLLFIEYAAFYEAENLKTVFIPASVEVLGFGAFEWCTSLESIYFQGDLPYGDYPDYYAPDDIPLLCLEDIWFPTDENEEQTIAVYYQIGKKGWDTLDADELADWGIRLLTFADETDDEAPLTSKTEAKTVTLPDGGGVTFEVVEALPEYGGIRTPEQLDAVRYDLSGKYILLQDIDMSKWGDWKPIGSFDEPFTGVFNGNGYNVSSIRINVVEEYQSEADSIYAGLFGVIKSAEIRNVTLTDGEYCITANRMVVGGITGNVLDASLLTNCSFNGVIKLNCIDLSLRVGGVAGALYGGSIIEYCTTSGTIEANGGSNPDIGGIAGDVAGMQTNSDDMKSCIRYSESECDIVLHSTTSRAYMGGVAGNVSIGEIHDCYFRGSISASDDAYAGGIAGRLNGVVRNCYSVGSIMGVNRYDEFATEENGYNYPSWFKLVSGLIGWREYSFADDQRVENCFTLAGLYSDLIGNDEWNTDSDAIRELFDDEMKRTESYENWDFSSVWTMDSATNYRYPTLRKPEIERIVVKASFDAKTLLFIALIAVGAAGCLILAIVYFRKRKNRKNHKIPERTISFCPYCGQKIADGSRFCGNCGNQI